MSKIAVVYFSNTGNTEAMADAIADALNGKADVKEIQASDFTADQVKDYDAIAFGCPAMGSEVLEEDVFEPMFESVEGELKGKKIALFGSYGWGDGEWMRNWADRCASDGAVLATDPVICQDAPDDAAKDQLAALAAALL